MTPIIRNDKLVAAKINVYAGDDDEYITFITPEAYTSLELWMNYRNSCGEHISKDSWVMRDLWNAAKLPKNKKKEISTTQSNLIILKFEPDFPLLHF